MNDNNVVTVNSINDIVKQQLWMDFEMVNYNGFDLLIGGSIDTSEELCLITIKFTEVYYISLNDSWQSDTSKDVLRILTENELKELRSNVTIDPSCIVFQFIPEDIYSSLYVAAKAISFEFDPKGLKASRK